VKWASGSTRGMTGKKTGSGLTATRPSGFTGSVISTSINGKTATNSSSPGSAMLMPTMFRKRPTATSIRSSPSGPSITGARGTSQSFGKWKMRSGRVTRGCERTYKYKKRRQSECLRLICSRTRISLQRCAYFYSKTYCPFTNSPSFRTVRMLSGLDRELISSSGLPFTMTTSASFPSSSVPTLSSQPMHSAADLVEATMASIGVMPQSTMRPSSRRLVPCRNTPILKFLFKLEHLSYRNFGINYIMPIVKIFYKIYIYILLKGYCGR
jgi:hypothetical protein